MKTYNENDIKRVMMGIVSDFKIEIDNVLNCKVRSNHMKYKDIYRYFDVNTKSLIIVRTIDWDNLEIEKFYNVQKDILIKMNEFAQKEIYEN